MLRLCVVLAIACHFANGQHPFGLSCVSDDMALLKADVIDLNNRLSVVEVKVQDADIRSDVIEAKIEGQEKCQSGMKVGTHTWPERTIPYTETIYFEKAFKDIPEFTYGLTLVDATKDTRVAVKLVDLTAEYFTVDFVTWTDQNLWGAKISWMACPK